MNREENMNINKKAEGVSFGRYISTLIVVL